jgi:hypothetical protein
MDPKSRDEKQTKFLQKFDKNYEGENVEKEVFMKLKACFKQSKFRNVFIFSAWDYNGGKFEENIQREFDFIVVSGDARKVIFIEVKRTNNQNNTQLKKAKSQLEKGYHFLREKIPFAKGWKFVSVVYLKNDEAETQNNFILGPKSNFNQSFEKYLGVGKSLSNSTDNVYKVNCKRSGG